MWSHRANVDNWMDDFTPDFEEAAKIEAVWFLDSVGNVWETCSPDDNHAKAFGPRGSARKVRRNVFASYRVIDADGEAGFTIVELVFL